jgi:hypothetical protein
VNFKQNRIIRRDEARRIAVEIVKVPDELVRPAFAITQAAGF